MKKRFEWKENHSQERQIYIEKKMTKFIDEHVEPCHQGKLTINLSINDPLDHQLYGNAVCSCGNILIKFRADTLMTKIEFE